MAIDKKPSEAPKSSIPTTEAQKDAINKKGLTDAIRDRAAELAVAFTDAGGNDLPRTDVEEKIRKAEASIKDN